MATPGTGDAVLDPVCDLDERPQAHDGLIPGKLVEVDDDAAVLLVAAHEAAGDSTAEGADDWAQRARYADRGLSEEEGSESDVVGPRRDQCSAPIEHGRFAITIGEEVERMQIAMTDHVRCRAPRMVCEPPGGVIEIERDRIRPLRCAAEPPGQEPR